MGTFSDFVTKFETTFKHHDTTGNTIAWLSTKHMTKGKNNTYSSSVKTLVLNLRGRINIRWFNLSLYPFVFGEKYYNFFTLLMSALSLQLFSNNETLFIINYTECSTT